MSKCLIVININLIKKIHKNIRVSTQKKKLKAVEHIYETPQYLTTAPPAADNIIQQEAAGNRLEPCTTIPPHLQGAAPQHTITQRPEHTHTHT